MVLIEIDKSLKISLHNAVLHFCLTIDQREESGKKPQLDFQKVKQQKPDLKGKNRASISEIESKRLWYGITTF